MVTPVISAINYKGGTGKTITSYCLAQSLTMNKSFNKNKPILIIDLDPLGNTSKLWDLLRYKNDGSSYPVQHTDLIGNNSDDSSSICDLWLSHIAKDGCDAIYESVIPIPYRTKNKMIHVVPADQELIFQTISLPLSEHYKIGENLRRWLRSDYINQTYSCVVIDTPPLKSSIVDAALTASTAVYIPFVPEPQSIETLLSVFFDIEKEQLNRKDDVPLRMLGLLPNMMTKVNLHRAHLDALKENKICGRYLMPFHFSRSVRYTEISCHKSMRTFVDLQESPMDIEIKIFAQHIIRLITGFGEQQINRKKIADIQ